MTSQDRVAKVIDRHGFDSCREPECIAQDLADANLLAPDLPEPSPGEEGALEWSDGEIWIEDDEAAVYIDVTKSFSRMTPNEARRLAHALLAAANYSEEA